MRLTISDQGNDLIQVTIDGLSYEDLDGSQLDNSIHAVQWYDTYGDVEYKDPTTGDMTHNVDIDSISDFQFAIDAWNVAKAAEDAAIALEIAKSEAYTSAYNQAIANGSSEEEAVTAGNAARDAVTSL